MANKKKPPSKPKRVDIFKFTSFMMVAMIGSDDLIMPKGNLKTNGVVTFRDYSYPRNNVI
jgi:hypothetical protein